MSGVVFVITVPTAAHEAYLKSDQPFDPFRPNAPLQEQDFNRRNHPSPAAAPPPPPPPPRLVVEVELRNKYAIAASKKRFMPKASNNSITIPLEKILEDLLKKLELDRVVWSVDKLGKFYQVIFPTGSGDPCETTLHCLTQLGIGVKYQSNVSVIPCSVVYDGQDRPEADFEDWTPEQQSKWEKFVDSIRSKLTVKQVVDGVRAGGSLSFDYILLIVTADSLAALGLVENNAPNIVAAMLVSPLMGPVMAVTFGAMIADKELVKSGFIAFSVGLLTSLLFGFIFGLILGTTEMPWGFGDWPTEEMKGRGNYRSLWMGVLWALTSGTGVAVALLVGSVGPLIGVAISASLLPPLVNCGLYWALACIWLIYEGVKMPHIKGEPYTGNSSYQFIYTDYIPTEFFISGIVSGLLTIVNVICIFITAIVVLKIKEVASPYTSSPDLRRFWEKDIREVRRTNRSTMRKKPFTSGLSNMARSPHNDNMNVMFEKAVQEATDNSTFRTVKRMSYANNNSEGTSLFSGQGKNPESPSTTPSPADLPSDSAAIDKLVSTLIQRLEVSKAEKNNLGSSFQGTRSRSIQFKRTGSSHAPSIKRFKTKDGAVLEGIGETSFIEAASGGGAGGNGMPTIKEQQSPLSETPPTNLASGMRNAFNSISDASQRLSQTLTSMATGGSQSTSAAEETANLTDNQEENALDN